MKLKKVSTGWKIFILFFGLFLFSQTIFILEVKNVSFNQHYLEEIYGDYNSLNFDGKINSIFSYQSWLLNELVNGKYSNNINFEKDYPVFDYVFKNLPYYSIVYPSYQYYYFQFDYSGKEFAGNLRFTETENGKLAFGYSEKDNFEKGSYFKLFDEADGFFVEKVSDEIVKINYDGHTKWFKIFSLSELPEKINLSKDEEVISKIIDESGINFYLIYNSHVNSFYYLAENGMLLENLEDLGKNSYMGLRTNYIYYFDSENNRFLLAGVSEQNIDKNNYFDGPFDQIPQYLDIREQIYFAYPYTKRNGGLDERWHFLDKENVRVAISPYIKYNNFNEILERVENCKNKNLEHSEFLLCLTYESKKDEHLKFPDIFYENGTLKNNSS